MRALALLLSLAVAGGVIDLVRRRRLREEFSWMWVLGTGGALLLSVVQPLREALGRLLGTDAEGACLTFGLLFLVLVCLDISTKVSRLANQQKSLAQSLGRLEKRLADLEEGRDGR